MEGVHPCWHKLGLQASSLLGIAKGTQGCARWWVLLQSLLPRDQWRCCCTVGAGQNLCLSIPMPTAHADVASPSPQAAAAAAARQQHQQQQRRQPEPSDWLGPGPRTAVPGLVCMEAQQL
jgi:hypothetical protein